MVGGGVSREMNQREMTARQREILSAVHTATFCKRWYRARSNGERVTLASLFRAGALSRRVWRGEGSNAAHEYTLSRMFWPDASLDPPG